MVDGVRQRKKAASSDASAGDADRSGGEDNGTRPGHKKKQKKKKTPLGGHVCFCLELLGLLLLALFVAVCAASLVRFGPTALGLTSALSPAEANAAAAAANAAVDAEVAAAAALVSPADVDVATAAPVEPLDPPAVMEDGTLLLTKAQLAQYDGTVPERPVYLGMLGEVFDVSAGRFYRPGGGYDFFAGKDGTRGFVTGDFTADGLDDDVESLEPKQMLDVEHWIEFYRDHEEYVCASVAVAVGVA